MDFEKSRFNMIEQQIRPWDVLDTDILDLLFHVKREQFVDTDKRSLAFTDTELPLPNGSFMLQPKVEARLLQGLQVGKQDVVLEIGTGSGYVTALLATLARHVVSVDVDGEQLARAAAHLAAAGIDNIELCEEDGLRHQGKQAYDAIFVGGALPVVPDTLRQQLAIGGRMVVIAGAQPVMRALLVRRDSEAVFSETVLFDTCIPCLDNADSIAPPAFTF